MSNKQKQQQQKQCIENIIFTAINVTLNKQNHEK